MAESEIKQLEQYIFSENKSEPISKLIAGTDSFYYFTLNHALNTYGLDLPKNHIETLEKYKKFTTTRATNIKLRYAFLKLADPKKTESELKAVLEELNKNTLHYNFDFDEPKTVVSTTITSSKQEISNKLDPTLLDWSKKIEESYNNHHTLNSLEDVALSYFDISKLAKSTNIDVIKAFLDRVVLAEYQDVEELIKNYFELNLKKAKTYQLDPNYYEKMTLEQLRKLGEILPELKKHMSYVGELFTKEFEIDRNDKGQFLGTPEEKIERAKKLTKMYEWSKKLSFKFDSFTEQLLYEILQLGIETNHFNFDLFIEYLRSPKKLYTHANAQQIKNLQNKTQNYESYWHNVHNCNVSRWLHDDKLIETYLEAYFKLNKKIGPFDEYLKPEYLKELFYKVKLYEGEEIPNISEILSSHVLKTIQDEKTISICKFNREYFTNNEEVKLFVEIKNIPSITIKIFELSAEDYYLKKNLEITGEINLDGLIACEETNIEFQEPPQKKVIKEFKFDNITNKKQGIFIIDFIGYGLSSRALIRKGKLLLIEKSTLAGQMFTILDEDLEICKRTQRTGLWIENRFHEANEHGVVNIPFSSQAKNVQAIIVHNSFACLTNINLIQEAYSFKCSYLYKDESFIMGNKMKLLIQTRLYLHQQAVSLDIIQEPSVSIITVTDTDIPSTVVFDKVKFDYKQEIELEIPVPAKLKSVHIQVKGKIRKMGSNKDEIQLYNDHKINMLNYLNESIFCGLYLKYSQCGYEIYALGKNGEPKINSIINVELSHKYLKSKINVQLQTDLEGKVFLGDLQNVYLIKASLREKGDIAAYPNQWFIENSSKVNYPNILNICQGDSLNLPYFSKELNKHKISFLKVLPIKSPKKPTLSNCIAQLKLSKNTLEFTNLQSGIYYLILKEENQTMELHVNEGNYWRNTNLMIMKDYLLNINNSLPLIVIEDPEVKTVNEKDQISFTVFSDDIKSTRVHILAYQFMNSNVNTYCNTIQNIIEKEQANVIPVTRSRNQYLSNKTLGDEYCYVLNRKKESRYIGNTLEKPQIFLKRTYIRDTTLEKEELGSGTGFKENIQYNEKKLQNEAFVSSSMSSDLSRDRKMLKRDEYDARPKNEGINEFLNFLQNPALLLCNIKPDAEGKIVLNDLNLEGYSTIEIVAINANTAVHEMIPLKRRSIASRDLRQAISDEKSKKYHSIFRNTSTLLQGEKFKVDDLTSTEIQIVDSLEKLFNLQKELQKADGKSSVENGKDYDIWKFIVNWNTLEIDEKIKKYDEYSCHELNLFLFFKDRAYFNNYVLPFLRNKIEKSFVDFFLIEDHKEILAFNSIEKMKNLNAMEKILMIIYLLQSNKKDEALFIAKLLENKNKTASYDQKTFKKYFDTILGSKSIETDSHLMKEATLEEKKKRLEELKANRNIEKCLEKSLRQMDRLEENIMLETCSFIKAASPRCYGVKKECVKMAKMSKIMMEKEESKEDYDGFGFDQPFYEQSNIKQRENFIEEFKNLEKTKEYAERHYYNIKSIEESSNLIDNSIFWVEMANHLIEKGLESPFLSSKFIYCTKNHATMLSVLAFIGLPFEFGNHDYKNFSGKGLEIQAASHLIVFHKEIKECQSNLRNDLLIAQRFYDPKDRYQISEEDPDMKFEKDVDEYIIDKIYGCEVIITNVSVTRQDFQVLYEIPEGAIPVQKNDYTKSTNLVVNSFTTQTLSFFFYFPYNGNFKVYPANISRNGLVLAVAKPISFEVHNERVSKKLETIDQILAQGSKDDILNFVATKNILNSDIFQFRNIYYLLKDREFYLKLVDILRKRRVYDHTAWSFSIYHGDIQSVKEFFNTSEITNIFKYSIKYFSNDLINIKNIRLLEYYPLMNARVHQLSREKSNILNKELKAQYKAFLEYLIEVPVYKTEDHLSLVYYLLLQDRIDEAIKVFSKIDRKSLDKCPNICLLQYDYFLGYLDFYSGYPNFKVAREICEKYLDYPVLSWRNLFYEMANQLAEYDGEELIDDVLATQDKKLTEAQKNLKSAKTEEILHAELQREEINISHQNCDVLTINYYIIDLEVLYSRNPFLLQSIDDFGFILPNHFEKLTLEKQSDLTKLLHKIPEKLQKSNIFIQIKSLSKTASLTYFSASLNVQIIEAYAQIKVTDKENKPLSRVYVKAFSKNKSGEISFYKDGYTDLRGRFDYASLNSDSLSSVEKFSFFIMSDEFGSLTKEASPPSTLGKMNVKIDLKSKKWNEKAQEKCDVLFENYNKEKMKKV